MRRGNNKKVGTYYLMAVQQESLSRARGTRKFFQSARPFHVLHNIVENRRDLLFFCWLSVQTFHFMGWKKNEEQVSKFWPRRHHGSPFCYGIVCPHFSKEKPPRKLQIVAYYVGRRTRLWENAVNNSHFEKIISNTDVTRQMLQFQLFIPRKIFCWQHNIQWPTEKVDYSTISITKTWYVKVI